MTPNCGCDGCDGRDGSFFLPPLLFSVTQRETQYIIIFLYKTHCGPPPRVLCVVFPRASLFSFLPLECSPFDSHLLPRKYHTMLSFFWGEKVFVCQQQKPQARAYSTSRNYILKLKRRARLFFPRQSLSHFSTFFGDHTHTKVLLVLVYYNI